MCAARLSIRSIAAVALGTWYWRSRFDFPHELCDLGTQLPPEELTRSQSIDWRELCRLLHGGDSLRKKLNRRRIENIGHTIFDCLEERQAITCFTDEQKRYANVTIHQTVTCSPSATSTQRALMEIGRSFSDVREVCVVFHEHDDNMYLSGLTFALRDAKVQVGLTDKPIRKNVKIPLDVTVEALVFAVTPDGFVGLMICVSGGHDTLTLGQTTSDLTVVALGRLDLKGYDSRGFEVTAARVSHFKSRHPKVSEYATLTRIRAASCQSQRYAPLDLVTSPTV